MREDQDHNTKSSIPLHPLLRNVGIEGGAIAVRLCAYLGSLGALALLAFHVLSTTTLLTGAKADAFAATPSANLWTHAIRPQPAFSAPVADLSSKAESYDIQRHPQGGRKDTLRFNAPAGGPTVLEIELYRPGAEQPFFQSATREIAGRSDVSTGSAQTAGVIETKFGAVPLISFVRNMGAATEPCLGFARDFGTPKMQISGFSCHGATPQLQRQSIACAFDRLTMLSAGNDTTLAALFARAELKRMGCGASPANADWVTATTQPVLRGSFASMTNDSESIGRRR